MSKIIKAIVAVLSANVSGCLMYLFLKWIVPFSGQTEWCWLVLVTIVVVYMILLGLIALAQKYLCRDNIFSAIVQIPFWFFWGYIIMTAPFPENNAVRQGSEALIATSITLISAFAIFGNIFLPFIVRSSNGKIIEKYEPLFLVVAVILQTNILGLSLYLLFNWLIPMVLSITQTWIIITVLVLGVFFAKKCILLALDTIQVILGLIFSPYHVQTLFILRNKIASYIHIPFWIFWTVKLILALISHNLYDYPGWQSVLAISVFVVFMLVVYDMISSPILGRWHLKRCADEIIDDYKNGIK